MVNPRNERLKRSYFEYLKEAEGKSEKTINGIRYDLCAYEKFIRFDDLSSLKKKVIISYKEMLSGLQSKKTDSLLCHATKSKKLMSVKKFYMWLAEKPGYKTKICKTDIEYFNLSAKGSRVARSGKYQAIPTLDNIRHAIFSMPEKTEIDRRNRAVMVFGILTGARVDALASFQLKHVDFDNKLVKQDPAEVRTKYSKRIDTYFFPVGDDIEKIAYDWVKYLREEGYSDDDPLFPRTKQKVNENYEFKSVGLEPHHWNTTGPIRHIYSRAFEDAGLPAFTPHSFRSTLVHMALKCCKTPEYFKAWSQNLGHENVTTTFASYGKVETHRQGDIIRSLAINDNKEDQFEAIMEALKEKGLM